MVRDLNRRQDAREQHLGAALPELQAAIEGLSR